MIEIEIYCLVIGLFLVNIQVITDNGACKEEKILMAKILRVYMDPRCRVPKIRIFSPLVAMLIGNMTGAVNALPDLEHYTFYKCNVLSRDCDPDPPLSSNQNTAASQYD